MASSTPKKSFSPATAAGVSYYKQFVFNFLKPYGKTDSVPTEEIVFKRLKGFNCEWLCRPKYAMSEMAETIVANMELLSDEDSYQPSILNQKELVSIKAKMQKFLDCLERLNTKSSSRALESDVFSMMTEMYEDELDQHFHDFIHLGSALYTMGIHYHVAKTLFVDMKTYAELLSQSDAQGSTGNFKKDPNVHTLRQMLEDCYYGGAAQSPATKKKSKDLLQSLLAGPGGLAGPSSGQTTESNSPPAHPAARKRLLCDEEEGSDSASEELVRKPKKKKKKSKKADS